MDSGFSMVGLQLFVSGDCYLRASVLALGDS